MNGLSDFFDGVINGVKSANFDTLLTADLSAFGGLFATTVLCCIFSRNVRGADKKPFLYLVNAFTAITFALFCTAFSMPSAAAFGAIFWLVGYLLYLVVRALFPENAKKKPNGFSSARSIPSAPEKSSLPAVAPSAKNAVRLEHALSIADRLLLKELGRGDRQELEKMKSTLSVLKIKGTLSAQEGETLNDIFNALLKLMARYDL